MRAQIEHQQKDVFQDRPCPFRTMRPRSSSQRSLAMSPTNVPGPSGKHYSTKVNRQTGCPICFKLLFLQENRRRDKNMKRIYFVMLTVRQEGRKEERLQAKGDSRPGLLCSRTLVLQGRGHCVVTARGHEDCAARSSALPSEH